MTCCHYDEPVPHGDELLRESDEFVGSVNAAIIFMVVAAETDGTTALVCPVSSCRKRIRLSEGHLERLDKYFDGLVGNTAI